MRIPSTRASRAASPGQKRRGRWYTSEAAVCRYQQEVGEPDDPDRSTAPALAARCVAHAVAVPKGGTGKTTTTINLGAALAEQGQRVLPVGFDPQGNLTQVLGFRPADLDHTVYSTIKYFLTRYESQQWHISSK